MRYDISADKAITSFYAAHLARAPEPPWYDLGRRVPDPVDVDLWALPERARQTLLLGAFLGAGPIPAEFPDDGSTVAALTRAGHARTSAEGLFVDRDVAAGIRASMVGDAADPIIAMARDMLIATLPMPDANDPATLQAWRLLLPHVLATVGDESDVDLWKLSRLANGAGMYFMVGKEAEAARSLLQRTLARNEVVLGPEHAEVAVTLANLGNVEAVLRHWDAAIEALERCIAMRAPGMRAKDASLAPVLGTLADALREAGRVEKATHYAERALKVVVDAYGPHDIRLAAPLWSLGRIALLQGRVDRTREYYTRALGLMEGRLLPGHPDLERARRDIMALGPR